jgi:hypothetical protein
MKNQVELVTCNVGVTTGLKNQGTHLTHTYLWKRLYQTLLRHYHLLSSIKTLLRHYHLRFQFCIGIRVMIFYDSYT